MKKSLFVLTFLTTICLNIFSQATSLVIAYKNSAMVGDVNGDGQVTAADVTAIYEYLLNNDNSNMINGDQNGDGEITAADVTTVYDVLLGNISPEQNGITEYDVNGVKFKMVDVVGGTFTMGTNQSSASSDEKPAHQVTLSSYSIGQTEVTQELWQAVMGSNSSYFNVTGNSTSGSHHDYPDYGTNLQRPVEYVSWDDCQEFITKLNQMTGKNFRLPTEAEWEYAAHGGSSSQGYRYSGSDNIYDVAWWRNNSQLNIPAYDPNYGTHIVMTKQPNELGLYDMSGNVNEWCQDWYSNNYYRQSNGVTNPTGPESGESRVIRGGAWCDNIDYCRVVSREYRPPTTWRLSDVGLRLVMSAE